MNGHFLYLVIDLCCISVPLAASFHPRISFYKRWRSALPAILLTAIVFLAWDALFTRAGVWAFNPRYVTGPRIAGLPLEEVFFFVCIPYACLFVFHCVELFGKAPTGNWAKWCAVGLSILLLAVGATHIRQYYTSVTFLSLGAMLAVLAARRAKFLPHFFMAFVILLIPFIVSNGILTGSLISEPVVMYNDACNLKIRILTIPVEDVFYGMEFQLMNVLFFKLFQRRGHTEYH